MSWKVSTRMLAATVLTLLAVLVLSLTVSGGVLVSGYARVVSGVVRAFMSDGALERCEALPAAWGLHVAEVRLFAYDPASQTSANPAAPTFAAELWREALATEWRAAARLPAGQHEGTVLVRVADRGPCAVVQVHWRSYWSPTSFGLFLFSLSAAMLVFGLVMVWLVSLRPLNQRIERVRRAASEVGHAEKSPTFEHHDDELGRISRALEEAHQHIRADAARLAAHHEELERHRADLAHDLRTPLASLQLALEAVHHASTPAVQPLVSAALQDVLYASSLTANLALESQFREGRLVTPAAPLNLGALVERVGERCAFFARHRGIEFAFTVPEHEVWVVGDNVAAEQALRNVMDNAITYVEPGGHIALLLEAAGTEFCITVVDDGPGVSPADLPRLNERTFRADAARRRDPRGSGLGLAITAAVCDALGWRLAFEAADPRGLRVVIAGTSTGSSQVVP
jgi:signal transduction histidine kinase